LKASKIIDEAYKRNRVFFSGKSKRGIIAGLFYCLDRSLGSFKTQKEIARSLNTTEMTGVERQAGIVQNLIKEGAYDIAKEFIDFIKTKKEEKQTQ
jgi:transcription initiation factor TFIIIB Brf1 subunit/transcription initiation factor TFIIB